MTTRRKYPDDTLPVRLRNLRDHGTEASALSALLYGSDRRTTEIAAERLRVLRRQPLPDPPWKLAERRQRELERRVHDPSCPVYQGYRRVCTCARGRQQTKEAT